MPAKAEKEEHQSLNLRRTGGTSTHRGPSDAGRCPCGLKQRMEAMGGCVLTFNANTYPGKDLGMILGPSQDPQFKAQFDRWHSSIRQEPARLVRSVSVVYALLLVPRQPGCS